MRKRWIFLALLASMGIALLWQRVEGISLFFHRILDPVLIPLLSWNVTLGMLTIVLVITIIVTLVQKYGTDQEEIKIIKKRQKELQQEMRKFKDHPEKMIELNKEQMEFMGRMMKMSMGTIVYTAVPFVLLIRWLNDYFTLNEGIRFLGIFSWFWFYLISSIVFSSILRKVFKVA